MKKSFSCIVLCLLFGGLKAQQGITFKIKYTPGHTYKISGNTRMQFKVNLNGDSAIINKLQAEGITQPVNVDVGVSMNTDIHTGALNAQKTFPITFNNNGLEIKGTINGKSIPIPNKPLNTTIYGHADLNGQYKIDSLNGKKLSDTSEKMVAQLMNSVSRQIKFPDHPLKVGDSFTQDTPLNLPIAGSNFAVDIKIVYKLVSIAGGNANFDMFQTMDMKLTLKQGTFSLNGTGTGKMVYSINNNFPAAYNSNLEIQFKGAISNLNLNGSANIGADYAYLLK